MQEACQKFLSQDDTPKKMTKTVNRLKRSKENVRARLAEIERATKLINKEFECLKKESDAVKLMECKIPSIDFFTQRPDSAKAIEPIDKEIKRIEGLIEAHKAQAYQRRKKGLAAEIKQVCNGEIAEIIAPETNRPFFDSILVF